MAKEIERRFLVDKTRLPSLKRGIFHIQGYLSLNPEIRIRLQRNRAFLTIKSPGDVVRSEFEYKVPLQDAKSLLELTHLKVAKTRYRLRLNGLTWEIDFYDGKNAGLVIAEVELPNPDLKFEKPLWLTREVSFDPRFKNVHLAESPIITWKKKKIAV